MIFITCFWFKFFLTTDFEILIRGRPATRIQAFSGLLCISTWPVSLSSEISSEVLSSNYNLVTSFIHACTMIGNVESQPALKWKSLLLIFLQVHFKHHIDGTSLGSYHRRFKSLAEVIGSYDLLTRAVLAIGLLRDQGYAAAPRLGRGWIWSADISAK